MAKAQKGNSTERNQALRDRRGEFKKKDVFFVPFAALKVKAEFNIRYDYGDIEELARSIETHGVRIPLHGTFDKDGYWISDGFRRYKAVEMLVKEGKAKGLMIPILPEPKGTNDETRVVDMFTKNSGKPLTPLEQAEGVKRLVAYGWDNKKMADTLNKSTVYIGKLITLGGAPQEIKNLIIKGMLSSTFAIDLLRGAPEKISEVLEQIKAGNFKDPGAEPGEANAGVGSGKQAAVRKRDIKVKSHNSFKELKTYVKSIEKKQLSPTGQKMYVFIEKIINNEIGIAQIRNFLK